VNHQQFLVTIKSDYCFCLVVQWGERVRETWMSFSAFFFNISVFGRFINYISYPLFTKYAPTNFGLRSLYLPPGFLEPPPQTSHERISGYLHNENRNGCSAVKLRRSSRSTLVSHQRLDLSERATRSSEHLKLHDIVINNKGKSFNHKSNSPNIRRKDGTYQRRRPSNYKQAVEASGI
jgi:hypothetical protein